MHNSRAHPPVTLRPARLAVLERMHRAAIRDSGLSRHETWMISRAAALLGVTDQELKALERTWRAMESREQAT